MSFLSTNAQAEKKTVLKSEIFDLKANIKINKEIIQGLFSDKNFKEKILIYVLLLFLLGNNLKEN